MNTCVANRHCPQRRALTLLELIVVVAILAAMAGMVLPLFGGLAYQSKTSVTMETLRRLQELILNRYRPAMQGAYLSQGTPAGINPDGLPRATPSSTPQMKYLYVDPNSGTSSAGFNPATGLGWNGPYMLGGYGVYPGNNPDAPSNGFGPVFGQTGDATPLDGWGNPIVIVYFTVQNSDGTNSPLYALLSAGPNEQFGTAVAGYTGAAIPATLSSPSATTDTNPSILESVAAPLNLTTTSDNTVYRYWLPLE